MQAPLVSTLQGILKERQSCKALKHQDLFALLMAWLILSNSDVAANDESVDSTIQKSKCECVCVCVSVGATLPTLLPVCLQLLQEYLQFN